MGWNTVEVSKYAEGTHEMTAPAWNEFEMVGSAVATMVASRQEMRAQSESPANTGMTIRGGNRLVWSVRTISLFLERSSLGTVVAVTVAGSGSVTFTERKSDSRTSALTRALPRAES